MGYFVEESPPILSGQNTPGYIPVETGYLPVSKAALRRKDNAAIDGEIILTNLSYLYGFTF